MALKFIPEVDHNPPILHTKFPVDIINTIRVIDDIIFYPVHGTWDTLHADKSESILRCEEAHAGWSIHFFIFTGYI